MRVLSPTLIACLLGVCLSGAGCKKSDPPKTRRAAPPKRAPKRALPPLAACPLKDADSELCQLWKRCSDKPAEECQRAGLMLERGEGGAKPDTKEALALYLRGCKAKHGGSCFQRSELLMQKGKTPKQVLDLLRKGCEYGSGPSCLRLGSIYEHGGEGLKQLPRRAFRFLQRACKLKEPNACLSVGLYHFEGREHIQKDVAKALGFLEGACKGGLGKACGKLGEARLEQKRPKAALPHLQKACRQGDTHGCALLGLLLYRGKVIRKELKRARKYFDKGCALRIGLACHYKAQMTLRGQGGARRNKKAAIKGFKSACQLSYVPACLLLIKYARVGKLPKSELLTHRKSACSFRHMESCFWLGKHFLARKDFKEARNYLESCCFSKNKKACALLKSLPKRK